MGSPFLRTFPSGRTDAAGRRALPHRARLEGRKDPRLRVQPGINAIKLALHYRQMDQQFKHKFCSRI